MTSPLGQKSFRRRALNLAVAATLSAGLLWFARVYGPRGGPPQPIDNSSEGPASGLATRENLTEAYHSLKTTLPGSGLDVIGRGCEATPLAEYFAGLEKEYRRKGYVSYSKGQRSAPGTRYYMLSAGVGMKMLWAFDRSSSPVPRYTLILGREEAACKTRWDAYEVTVQGKTAASVRPDALVVPVIPADGLPVPPGARQTLGVAGVAGTAVFAFEVELAPSAILTWYRDRSRHNWNIQGLAPQNAAAKEPDCIYLTRSGRYCIVMLQSVGTTGHSTVYLTTGQL